MNGTDANEYFHKGVIKTCVMEKPAEGALLKYARFNRCPRCDAARLHALGELKTERGPIGILVCLECEFGIYVESTAAVVKGSAEQRARDILVRNASSLAAEDVVELEKVIADNERLLAGEKAADKRIQELEHSVEGLDQDYKNVMRDWNGAREILLPFLEDESQDVEIATIASAARDRIEQLQKLSQSQIDTLAHFCETLEAVQGPEEFGDLVLRLLKERDRSRRAICFAMSTIRSGEDMTPEAEKIFTEALGSYSPLTFTVSCLGLLTDMPDELVVGARILARELGKPVYLTRSRSPGGISLSVGVWSITIKRDGYGSEVRIDPDGSAHEMDVYT